ncbi:hypothetical protein PPMP20_06385 [Paraburkholderia phymatum]|uniref:hypothetical protein n=1 Tax=Paraburkholderia phymatum TaxID=148447 RepID=UPI0015902D31|nr:hypothetical protein [Paraburkholderia phymatum]
MEGMLPRAEMVFLKEHYAALSRLVEYEEKAGRLIELARADELVLAAHSDAWLAWPSRRSIFTFLVRGLRGRPFKGDAQ